VIRKIVLKNFLQFRETEIDFEAGLNIVVGDNEAGKSTLLEAINLVLSYRWQGRLFNTELSQSFINSEAVNEYLEAVKAGDKPQPPEVVIELYLDAVAATAHLKGRNNSLLEDSVGLRLCAKLDAVFADEYKTFLESPSGVKGVPVEFYRVDWHDFAQNMVNARAVKITASLIDASRIRLESGADYYLQRIIKESLDNKQRAQLASSFRLLQEEFAAYPEIQEINNALDANQDEITDKRLTLAMDASQSTNWEGSLAPHLDNLPFQFSGSGERNKLKILLALARKLEDAHVILIEEPENHLSFSSLNQLIEKIGAKCKDRQVIIATHSSYVVNKLGLENLMLLSGQQVSRLTDLPTGTRDYFRKLPGYDTLRLVLAKAAFLVASSFVANACA